MPSNGQEQPVQESLLSHSHLSINAPRLPRHNPFANRHIPRTSRLRPPQAIVHRDPEGNIVGERPSNISTAISMTRAHYLGSLSDSTLYPGDHHSPDLCTQEEKAVNLSLLCHQPLERIPNNYNYVPLGFDIILQDGGQYSYNYAIQNTLRNDQTVYCASRCGTVNILFRYTGSKPNEFRRSQCCYLSHIVIKTPLYGTSSYKQGMLFISHNPIDIEVTRPFDLYDEEHYQNYIEKKHHLGPSDPVAWFNSQQINLINLHGKSAKYVLIKLIGTDSDSVNLEYIGFVGYVGSRCFAHAQLC